MPESDETIIIEFLAKADQFFAQEGKVRNELDQLKSKMMELHATTSRSFREIGAIMRQEFKEEQITNFGKKLEGAGHSIQRFNELSRTAVSELNTEMRQAEGGTQSFSDRLGGLGTVANFVFGSVLGLTAINVLRRIISFLTDAGETLIAFRRNIFLLEVGIRALQRSGMDTTIAEWTEQIDEFKKRFPIFPVTEIVDAFDKAILKLREYNFTQEETIKLLEAAALLSRLTGMDFGQMADRITGAITRGWFEALQNLGIPLSRLELMQEAYNQSLEKSFNLLDESTRAHLAYQLLLENLGDITADASQITEESFDRIAIANAKVTDAQLKLGRNSEVILVKIKELWAFLVEGIAEGLANAQRDIGNFVKWLETSNAKIEMSLINLALRFIDFSEIAGIVFGRPQDLSASRAFFESQLDIIEQRLDGLAQKAEETADSVVESMLRMGDLPAQVGAPIMFEGMEFSPEEFQEIVDATQDLAEEINKIDEEAKEKNHKIWVDWFRDREEIVDKHQERLADLEQDLANKLSDIDISEQRKVADEIADNAFRVAEAIRQANFRREDAERKYREREIREEKKFQEKLRQLRENFLLDLEDAVRERDARQIIRLTRQYNLRRTQMIREEKLGKDDRQAQFQEELRQIEFQRQERLRQLAIEHQRRLDDIARQAQRERDQAQVNYERRKADEDARFEQDKIRRDDRRDELLADVIEGTQERINAVIESLQKEYELTEPQLDAIISLYENAYGPDGRINASLVHFQNQMLVTEMLMRRLQALTQAFAPMFGMTFVPPGFGQETNFAGEQSEGGTIIARKPTVAIFGEAGPEVAQFTPLNRLGANAPSQITPMNMEQMSRSGRIRLEIKIIDNTLGEIADVNFSIERARK